MRKFLSIVVGLILASSFVAAQASKAPAVKKVTEQITLTDDVKVGSTVLKSGKYEVSSKNTALTFRKLIPDTSYPNEWVFDGKEKPVVVTCTITPLPEKRHGTDLDIPIDGGVHMLKALTFDGTNYTFTIEH
jgi:hypothetical protein